MTSALFAYQEFMALRHHFTTESYDYIKYNGKIKFPWRKEYNFENHRDYYQYQKLSKKPDLQNFILANVIKKPKIWIRELNSSEECEKNYIDWKKRKESFSYILSEEIKIFDNDAFKNIPVNFYNFLRCYSLRQISLETLYVLYMLLNIYGIVFIADDPLLNDIEFKLQKYKPFMEKNFLTNERKILNIVTDKFGSPIF
jgi:hypothetical protein